MDFGDKPKSRIKGFDNRPHIPLFKNLHTNVPSLGVEKPSLA
jgi:hypothetical protein